MMKLGLLLTLLIFNKTGWAFFTSEETVILSESNKDVLSHDKVNEWTQDFEQQLSPLVQNHGGELHVVVDWSSDRANAEAKRDGKQFLVIIYAGLLRHPEVSRNMIDLILCHEVGHHLGGQPTASRSGWSAAEGQADYYSSLECIKELPWASPDKLPAEFEKLSRFYAKIQSTNNHMTPSLGQKDPTEVLRTFFGHPSPQCRLDTLIAGLYNEPRPSCWFKE